MAGEERASFALLRSSVTRMPHMAVREGLRSPFERFEKGCRAVPSNQWRARIDLGHRQSPPGRGDRVALARVPLLSLAKFVDSGIQALTVDDRRQRAH